MENKDIRRYEARHAAWEEAVKAENPGSSVPRTNSEATKIGAEEEAAVAETHEEKLARFHIPVYERPVELSAWQVLVTLASLPRGMVAFLLVFVFGFIIGCIDSTLAVRVAAVWNKDSDYVGLIYLAAAAPAFFGGPISGWLADKYGSEWIILPAVAFCLPWLPLMSLKSSLAGFIIYFAMTLLVATVLNSVASLEMAIVSKFKPGISEIHEFAAMNLAFAISSAIGAIIGGQIYDNVPNGWNVVCWIGFGAFAACIVPPLVWTGKIPLLSRLRRRPPPRSCIPPDEREYWDKKARGEDPEAAEVKAAATSPAPAATSPAPAATEVESTPEHTQADAEPSVRAA
jgi:MFS family permease